MQQFERQTFWSGLKRTFPGLQTTASSVSPWGSVAGSGFILNHQSPFRIHDSSRIAAGFCRLERFLGGVKRVRSARSVLSPDECSTAALFCGVFDIQYSIHFEYCSKSLFLNIGWSLVFEVQGARTLEQEGIIGNSQNLCFA